MTLSPETVAATIAPEESGVFHVAPSDVSIRPYPFPYIAALAVNNDIDSTLRDAFEDWHAFVSGRGPTSYGDGLGLEVADSFWVWSGEKNHVISVHRQYSDQEERVDSPDLPRIVELARSGWIDTLHSFGNWRQDYQSVRHDLGRRDEAKYALDRLDQLGIKPSLFVNHSSSPSNVGGEWGFYQKADDPDHPFYCLDLLKAFGFRFFWIDPCIDMEKFGNHLEYDSIAELRAAFKTYGWGPWLRRRAIDKPIVPIDMPEDESAYRKKLVGFFNRAILPVNTRDGSQILAFKRYRGLDQPTMSTFAYQVSADNLDSLEARRGVVVVYQHFGVRSPRGRTKNVEKNMRGRTVPPVLDEHAVACWREIADRHQSGRLFVATTSRLLNYIWMRENVGVTVEKRTDRWLIELDEIECPVLGASALNESNLNGVSFVIPEDAPETTVTVKGRTGTLDFKRASDPGFRHCHALYRPWNALIWPG